MVFYHVFALDPRKKDQDANVFLFKKVPLEAKGALMYHSGDTCGIHSFFKYFFEKTAELCSGKGAALSLPLAAIPQKTNE